MLLQVFALEIQLLILDEFVEEGAEAVEREPDDVVEVAVDALDQNASASL